MNNTLSSPSDSEIALHKLMSVPLKRNMGLMIHIHRYFTDVNGILLDKSTVPSSLQVDYPFWLFGEFDRAGGYRIGNQINPPIVGTSYVCSFTQGINVPFLFATGANQVKNKINTGDVVHIFTDNLDAPNYYIWVVLSTDVSALGSIYTNATAPEKQKIDISGINFFAYMDGGLSVPQYAKNLNLTRMDVLGSYRNVPYPPTSNYQVNDYQEYFIQVPLKCLVDQYNMISSYIDFNADNIALSLFVNKNTLKV